MRELQIFVSIIIFLIISYISLISSNPSKEFIINKFLKLKLDSGRTNIYVKGRVFQQCMYLLINIPTKQVEDYDEIESIDEAAETLDKSLEGNQNSGFKISPEEEFRGHCSNLQVWAENGYDTRILHRNLAFPLLKRLTEVGDPIAKKVFKEEIAIRFASKHPTVTQYLTENGYLRYLSADEFESILDDVNPILLSNLTEGIKLMFENPQNIDIKVQINYFINSLLRNFGIEHISLLTSRILKEIPKKNCEIFVKTVYELFKLRKYFPLIQYLNQHFEHFKDFEFDYDFIKYKDKLVGIYSSKKVILNNQNINDISKIEILNGKSEEIEELDLSNNDIINMEGLESFPNLKTLKLNNNQITKLRGIKNLNNLENLFLRGNRVSEIVGVENFTHLKHIDLSGNSVITEIPEELNYLDELETVKLWNCNIKKFTESTEKYFWTNQNYRYYTGYTEEDKLYYENNHIKKASSEKGLYKDFVKGVLRTRKVITEQKLSYKDIFDYENETSRKAIWSGRATHDFSKWMKNKNQTKITYFL